MRERLPRGSRIWRRHESAGVPGYEDKVKAAKEKTGLHEAVTIGHCKIYGEDAVLGICDARFLMSSMGHVMGRKLPALWNARQRRSAGHPVLLLRWRQNAGGIVSTMQMAKHLRH